MMLVAVDAGIASGHRGIEDQDLVRDVLSLADDRFCAYLVPLGFADDRPLEPVASPDRRSFDDVVHWGWF